MVWQTCLTPSSAARTARTAASGSSTVPFLADHRGFSRFNFNQASLFRASNTSFMVRMPT